MQSLSVANHEKFYWMRYQLERGMNVDVKGETQKIVKGDLFGVREVRGSTTDEIMLQTGKTFRLEIKKSEILMNRSKEFRGKVKIKDVKPAVSQKAVVPKLLPAKVTAKQPAVKVKTTKSQPVVRLLQHELKGPIRVKLSEVHMPDEDDFTDHELPAEFRKYAVSESSTNWMTVLASPAELRDIVPGTLSEFNQIVKSLIEPHIKNARHEIDTAIKTAAARVKAWAMVHLQQAKKLGKNTILFEKLVNNPTAAVRQLAHSILGAPAPQAAVEAEKIDDLLSGITF